MALSKNFKDKNIFLHWRNNHGSRDGERREQWWKIVGFFVQGRFWLFVRRWGNFRRKNYGGVERRRGLVTEKEKEEVIKKKEKRDSSCSWTFLSIVSHFLSFYKLSSGWLQIYRCMNGLKAWRGLKFVFLWWEHKYMYIQINKCTWSSYTNTL